jgi:hypothetical protein
MAAVWHPRLAAAPKTAQCPAASSLRTYYRGAVTLIEWRDRFRLPVVGFPVSSPHTPQRLVFVSNEGGSTQVWTVDTTNGERRAVTDQRVGVEEFVLSPRGDAVAWWSDDSGDGNGAWVSTRLSDGATEPLLTGLGPGWSEGIAWSGETVAIALTDETTYRVYVGAPGGAGRLVAESTQPMGPATCCTSDYGSSTCPPTRCSTSSSTKG